MYSRPHFIGIGQMKAGTGWLYDQMTAHPDTWMPIKKELHFFNNGFNFDPTRRVFRSFLGTDDNTTFLGEQAIDPEQHLASLIQAGRSQDYARLQAHLDFFSRALLTEEAQKMERRQGVRANGVDLKPKNFDWYSGLFPEGYWLTGEITPGYATLDRKMIRRVRRRFPDSKFIMSVREPVSRALSHLNHRLRNAAAKVPDADPNDRAFQLGILEAAPDIVQKSRLTSLQETWFNLVPQDLMHVILFKDIAERPERVLAQLADFLGVSADGFTRAPDHNAKSGYEKFDIHSDVVAELRRALADEVSAYAEFLHREA